MGMVNLAVLACFEGTTKKVVNFFSRKKCTPEKILATPMKSSSRSELCLCQFPTVKPASAKEVMFFTLGVCLCFCLNCLS